MINTRKQILAISGSIRRNSTNEAILKLIAKLYADDLDVLMYSDIDKLPYFNPDLDYESFRELIEKADGIIICTPEYVFGLPGALKNAMEWTVSTTVFSNKPFVFIVASGSGERAFESLDVIMSTLLQYKIPDNAKLLIKGGRSKVNEHGEIIDPKVLEEIKEIVDTLIVEIENPINVIG
jgi:NAD(P)H-dependent FMN reductase